MIVVILLEVGRGARCVLSQPGPVLSQTPRSVASLAGYRRLKQHHVLPSVDPKGPKAYEMTLSSPTDWQTGSLIQLEAACATFRNYFALLS
jgi:hypothetical protein